MIRRNISLLVAATVAFGVGIAGASPAAAQPAAQTQFTVLSINSCLEYRQIDWQYNSVGSNKALSSCYAESNFPNLGEFTAITQVISTSNWTGFHGCVKLEFIYSYTGEVVHTSGQQRWGVNAGQRRVLQWSGTMPSPNAFWNSIHFVHWRC